MRDCLARVSAAVAVSAAAGLGATGVSAAGAATRSPQPVRATSPLVLHASSASGIQRWVQRYNGSGMGSDVGRAVAVSPGGRRVFVTGESTGASSGLDYATAGYNAATGARLWVSRYNGPGNAFDIAYSVAVSQDGGTVYVTGASTGAVAAEEPLDYATVAYNAATGARRWVTRYDGAGRDDQAGVVAVSPDGRTVYVTGISNGGACTTGPDYATVAYNAATGARRWVKRYNNLTTDGASSLAVSPDGRTVYVTGSSDDGASYIDYATIAYNAATGAQRWVKRYTSGAGTTLDTATSVRVSPAGDTVYVTGYGGPVTLRPDYVTVAYNAATGARRWVKRYNGPGNGEDQANAMAVSPTTGNVYVTGGSAGGATGQDFATIAYSK